MLLRIPCCQMKRKMIRPKFVDLIPDNITEGVLYVSIRFATATHKCACGCSELVVTPIRPTDWTLIWDRDTISLWPSIGNWNFQCRSHYFIRKSKIVWVRKWSDSEIKSGRRIDKARKDRYYDAFQIFDKE